MESNRFKMYDYSLYEMFKEYIAMVTLNDMNSSLLNSDEKYKMYDYSLFKIVKKYIAIMT